MPDRYVQRGRTATRGTCWWRVPTADPRPATLRPGNAVGEQAHGVRLTPQRAPEPPVFGQAHRPGNRFHPLQPLQPSRASSWP